MRRERERFVLSASERSEGEEEEEEDEEEEEEEDVSTGERRWLETRCPTLTSVTFPSAPAAEMTGRSLPAPLYVFRASTKTLQEPEWLERLMGDLLLFTTTVCFCFQQKKMAKNSPDFSLVYFSF